MIYYRIERKILYASRGEYGGWIVMIYYRIESDKTRNNSTKTRKKMIYYRIERQIIRSYAEANMKHDDLL